MPIGVNQYQGLSPEQANPFGHGLAQGIAMRLAQAQAQKQESENPYVGRKAMAEAIQQELMNKNQQNVNQYYGKNIESQIGERGANTKYLGAETSIKELERMYPNIKDSGVKGDQDRQRFLADHQQRMQGQQPSGLADNVAPIIGNQQQPMPGKLAQDVAPVIDAQNPEGRTLFPETVTSKNSPYKALERQGLINQQPQSGPAQQQATEQQPSPNAQVSDSEQINQLNRNINADIGGKEALAKYHARAIGSGNGAASLQVQNKVMEGIKRLNPDLTDDQAFEATGNAIDGKYTLDNGQPFKVNGLVTTNASKAALQGTTASLATNLVQGKQAEAEIGVLSKFALEGIKPYGTTYMNKSVDQIYDTLSDDPKAQKKLGKLIAAKQLQYEIAQNETKLAGGQPGVTNTQELMHLGQQSIDTHFPKLSYEAREEAQRYFLEALKEGFKARQKVGTRVNNAAAISEEPTEKATEFVRGPDGKFVSKQ